VAADDGEAEDEAGNDSQFRVGDSFGFGSILDPEVQAEDGEDRRQAVQSAGRLAVLYLMNRARADPSRQSELVLAQAQ
jgi:hypothetical protein